MAWVIIVRAAKKVRKTLNNCRITAGPTEIIITNGQLTPAYHPTLEVMNGNDHP